MDYVFTYRLKHNKNYDGIDIHLDKNEILEETQDHLIVKGYYSVSVACHKTEKLDKQQTGYFSSREMALAAAKKEALDRAESHKRQVDLYQDLVDRLNKMV